MAENKAIVIPLKYINTLDLLSGDDCKKLIIMLMDNAIEGKEFEPTDNALFDAVAYPIFADVMGSITKYNSKCKANAENGKKGGRPKKEEKEEPVAEKKADEKKPAEKKATEKKSAKAVDNNEEDSMSVDVKSICSETIEQAYANYGNKKRTGRGRYKNVNLSDGEYLKLKVEFGKEYLDKAIERLSKDINDGNEEVYDCAMLRVKGVLYSHGINPVKVIDRSEFTEEEIAIVFPNGIEETEKRDKYECLDRPF